MKLCKFCNNTCKIPYQDTWYCSYLPCVLVYPHFLYYFLQQIKPYVHEFILQRILLSRMINIWTHPVDILELSLLPYNNDNPVYKFLSQDLKTQELNDFQNSLMWLEAYRDEDTIRSLWFPTLKNQSQDLIPLLRKRVIVKDFLNTFITQPEHKEFYYPYFTSPTIHDYVTKHITWLQRYHI